MWYNSNTLTGNARDVRSGPALGTIFPIFITPMTHILLRMEHTTYVLGLFVLTYLSRDYSNAFSDG